MDRLLAGNLAGNLQNSADFTPFRAVPRLDRVTYQYVGPEFPVPGGNREFRPRNREFVRRTFQGWCANYTPQGAAVAVDAGLGVSGLSSATLAGATVVVS
jgi:hypothetical protein